MIVITMRKPRALAAGVVRTASFGGFLVHVFERSAGLRDSHK